MMSGAWHSERCSIQVLVGSRKAVGLIPRDKSHNRASRLRQTPHSAIYLLVDTGDLDVRTGVSTASIALTGVHHIAGLRKTRHCTGSRLFSTCVEVSHTTRAK